MDGVFWIDGFNLFHRWKPTRPLFARGADPAVGQEQALKRLGHTLGKRRRRTTVFMDGGVQREQASRYGLRISWAGPGGKADDLMVEGLQGRPGRTREVIVVSNDRALTARLRALGARRLGVDGFIRECLAAGPRQGRDASVAAHQKTRTLSRHEVDAWLEIFSEEGQDQHGG